jgi:hypothetical protein
MGKQIRFVMSEDDEVEFVRFLTSDPDVVLLLEYSPVDPPVEFRELPEVNESGMGTDVVILNKRITKKVHLRKVRDRDYYAIDKMKSEVIEFARSKIVAGRRRSGRLWIEANAHDDAFHLVEKSAAFGSWYDKLARWIRTHYHRQGDVFVGPGSAELDPMNRPGSAGGSVA